MDSLMLILLAILIPCFLFTCGWFSGRLAMQNKMNKSGYVLIHGTPYKLTCALSAQDRLNRALEADFND